MNVSSPSDASPALDFGGVFGAAFVGDALALGPADLKILPSHFPIPPTMVASRSIDEAMSLHVWIDQYLVIRDIGS